MKKTFKPFIGFLTILTLTLGSCKSTEETSIEPQPIANTASIKTLTSYLSNTLGVSQNEIQYLATSKTFVVRQSIQITEEKTQQMYNAANEYKHFHKNN